MKNTIKNYFILFLLSFVLSSCVATSNFHSGKVLEENKLSFSFGANDIVLKSADKSISISKDVPFVPSLALSYGLPLRFETGIRYFPTRLLEVSLRHQLNPPTFNFLDGSLNFTYSHLFGGYSYLQFGVSISKNIHGFEPYVHYSMYKYIGATEGNFSDSFISGAINNFVNNNRIIGFGLGIPFKGTKLFPEVNYQYYGNDLQNGLWHFGLGIQIYLN